MKSVVRLVGHPDAVAAHGAEWVTERVRTTCKVDAPNSECEVLGAAVGPPPTADALFSTGALPRRGQGSGTKNIKGQ